MRPSARLAALLEVLEVSFDPSTPLDQALQTYFKKRRYAGAKDRRFIIDALYDLIRQRERLHFLLREKKLEVSPRLLFLAWVAQNDPDATETLEEWAVTGHAPPLDSKERAYLTLLKGPLSNTELPPFVKGNVPEPLYPFFERAFKEETLDALQAMNRSAPTDLRLNLLKASLDDLTSYCDLIDADKTPLSPWGLRLKKRGPLITLPLYRDGLVEVQDEGSQLLTFLVGARPEHRVLDYCAGAGGKMLALAAHMKNKGLIAAYDVSQARLRQAERRAKRAGVTIARFLNSSELDAFKGGFDHVILDVPCSGTGTWRRTPEQRWHLTEQTLKSLLKTQENILEEGAQYVKEGGRLFYMTCSVFEEENEDQVNIFLKKHLDFFQIPCREIAAQALPSILPYCNESLRLSPHKTKTDGFFLSVLQKKKK